MQILISSDHAGFSLKKHIIEKMNKTRLNLDNKTSTELNIIDLGPDVYDANDDYPVFAFDLAKRIQADDSALGIMICATGQGSAMALNRFIGVRAAVCITQKMAKLAREHNHSNVLCLGAKLIGQKKALAIVRRYLRSQFLAGRHQRRVELIDRC
jgi:ribose 5-phosphate isomerase B